MSPDRFPLTPLQHAMVCAWLRRPHSGINVEQWIVTLREPIRAPLFRAAWCGVVRSYGMLRASIDLTDPGNPQQTIVANVDEAWEEIDWRDAPPDEQALRWREFLETDRCRGLDLTRPPLWRVVLVRMADDEFHFICTFHHVLLCGRSLVQIGREVFARYDALARGEALPTEPEAPFRKFVEYFGRSESASAEYWRRYLAKRAPVRLPEPHAPPIADADYRRTHRSIGCQRTLDAKVTARLFAAARGADVTLHTLAQAAWGLTLAAFTGEDDHVFGSVRACRKLPVKGISRMVGMLINTVPFRVQLRRDETVERLLGRLRDAQVEHRLHESTSASDVARFVCQPANEPLFPTLLMFTDRRPETMLDVGGRPHPTRTVQLLERSEFPLALVVGVGVDEVTSIRLEYDTERYKTATAERVLEHFQMTLEALPDYLVRSVDDLPCVIPADRERLLTLGRSPHESDVTLTVPALIERRVEAGPNEVAIVDGSRVVTYAELRRMATAAAANLRRRCIGRGTLVGVFCEQSPEMVALVLGLWRIGAVYVPLDPKYPSQRLGAIVADAAPELVVFDQALPDSLDDRLDQTVRLDRLFEGAEHAAAAEIESAATLADRAVVLYTSGSTGTPKGVVLTHRNLANQTAYVVRTLQLAVGDRLAPVSSINFDASLEEHFAPLAAAATIVLSTGDELDSCARFFEFVVRQRLTILDVPTSLWRELTNYLHDERREYPDCVRAIMMGGEVATRAIYEKFLKVGGRNIRWFNAYGPTETTICSTVYEHQPDRDADETGPPPIGRPIDGTTAVVLDRCGRLVPPGVRGELYLSGAGVAEGYLNRDDLTRERFVELTGRDVPAGRYYRTGDEVRFREDGELEYIGRLDEQVKLRGFRIEPAEIEAVLLKHLAVRDAVAVVLTAAAGTQYLAAYLVLHSGAAWDERSLREFAAARLPQYMRPQAFVQLDVLPLSPNGKINRRSLPEPFADVRSSPPAAEPTEPRKPTLLEHRLLEVWRTTLAMDNLGLDDDFFQLGGDSLRAMTLIARLEESLGRSISVATLIAVPTVARLAAHLEAEAATDDKREATGVAQLRDGDEKRPLFFVHSLAGDVWIYRDLVQTLRTDAAMYGLQMPGIDGDAPPSSDDVETWAALYVERVRAVQPTGPYRLAGFSSGGLLSFEMARQLHAAGQAVEFLGLIDSSLPTVVERRLTASRLRRYTGLLRSLPGLSNELRKQSFSEQRRRVRWLALSLLRRCFTMRRASATTDELNDREIMDYFAEDISFFPAERLDLIRRHYRALDRYAPPKVAIDAILFRSTRQPMFAVPTPTMGWEELIGGSLSVHQVGGEHGTLMRPPFVERLAAAIDALQL
jgi:amino acid adenylation domain-containing protein